MIQEIALCSLLDPIGTVNFGNKYAVLEADGKFAPTVANNTDLPDLPELNSLSQKLWIWKAGTAYAAQRIWEIQRDS